MVFFVLDVLIDSILFIMKQDLLVDQFFVLFSIETIELKLKIEWLDKFSLRFILFKMQRFQEWVLKCLFNGNTLFRIEFKHLTNEINCIRVKFLKDLVKTGSFRFWQSSDEFLVFFESDLVNKIILWHTNQVCNKLDLLLLGATR